MTLENTSSSLEKLPNELVLHILEHVAYSKEQHQALKTTSRGFNALLKDFKASYMRNVHINQFSRVDIDFANLSKELGPIVDMDWLDKAGKAYAVLDRIRTKLDEAVNTDESKTGLVFRYDWSIMKAALCLLEHLQYQGPNEEIADYMNDLPIGSISLLVYLGFHLNFAFQIVAPRLFDMTMQPINSKYIYETDRYTEEEKREQECQRRLEILNHGATYLDDLILERGAKFVLELLNEDKAALDIVYDRKDMRDFQQCNTIHITMGARRAQSLSYIRDSAFMVKTRCNYEQIWARWDRLWNPEQPAWPYDGVPSVDDMLAGLK